jgi:hypothetical protein
MSIKYILNLVCIQLCVHPGYTVWLIIKAINNRRLKTEGPPGRFIQIYVLHLYTRVRPYLGVMSGSSGHKSQAIDHSVHLDLERFLLRCTELIFVSSHVHHRIHSRGFCDTCDPVRDCLITCRRLGQGFKAIQDVFLQHAFRILSTCRRTYNVILIRIRSLNKIIEY